MTQISVILPQSRNYFHPWRHMGPLAPPGNAEDATQQLAQFLPNSETPAALRGLLAARTDPNVCEGTDVGPLPLLPEIQRDTIIARIDPHKNMRKNAMTPLMKVICFAREEHSEASAMDPFG